MSDIWTNATHLKESLKSGEPSQTQKEDPLVVIAPLEDEKSPFHYHQVNKNANQQPQQQQQREEKGKEEKAVDELVEELEKDISTFAFQYERVLVLDTSSLLQWSDIHLEQLGTVFYTTSGIIDEIKDSQSRSALNTLPMKLHIRNPLRDSILQVKKYALKTGDYTALSANDMAILALSYELEMELNGNNNCLNPVPEDLNVKSGGKYRKVPIVPYESVFGNDEGSYENDDDDGEDDHYADVDNDDHQGHEEERETDETNHTNEEDEGWTTFKKKRRNRRKIDTAGEAALFNYYGPEGRGPSSDVEDDDPNVGWVTPHNVDIKRQQAVGTARAEKWGENNNSSDQLSQPSEGNDEPHHTNLESTSKLSRHAIGCATTDYAMQNVLLHMGIDLVSFDGKRIKELKRWVKRCESCSCLVTDMMRQFCPLCGNHTLKRVTCYIDKDGNEHFLFNPQRRPNLRGTIFHIPRPKGGRRNLDPILTEDMTRQYQNGIPKKNSFLLNKKSRRARADGDAAMNMVFSTDYTFEKSIKNKQIQHKDMSVLKNGVWTGYSRRNPNEPVRLAVKKKNKR